MNEDNHSLVKILLEDGRADPREALTSAIMNSRINTVSILLADKRVDPSIRNNEALFLCTEEDRYECVRILLKDPRVNPNDRNGDILCSAIQAVCSISYPLSLEYLLADERTDPTIGNNKVLYSAIEHENVHAIEMLLQREEVRTLLDESYLTLALDTENEEVIDMIREMLE